MAKYVGNPYNFVPLNKQVKVRYEKPENLPAHNELTPERLSGEIGYEIKAITDIYIGSEKEKAAFYRSADGTYAIPGSSMRGLVRGNMQILGQSSIADDVEDYRLMYRMVGQGKSDLAEYYKDILGVASKQLKSGKKNKTISVTENVKAGYLVNENGTYRIYRPQGKKIGGVYGEMNYYPLRETTIFKAVEEANRNKKINPYELLKSEYQTILLNTGDKFNKKGKQLVARSNPDYIPYQMSVSYELTGEKDITAVGKVGEYTNKGVAVSSGPMNGKKTLYIVPKISNQFELEISKEDITSYQRDYEGKKNLLGAIEVKKLFGKEKDEKKEKFEQYYSLPEEGQTKIVFYIWLQGHLFFGFTPYLRVFYENSILQGLPVNHRPEAEKKIDYTTALLGYTDNKNKTSYKSRVYFEDAKLQNERETYSCKEVLASPKMSSYMDYLINSEDEKKPITYNEDFVLRGVKQYWLRDEIVHNAGNGNDKTGTDLKPLKKGAIFKGIIRFKNLSCDELGLLLWSIKLDKDCQQNIGMAKALGYGRIDLQINQFHLFDLEKMYTGFSLNFSPYQENEEIGKQIEKYIKIYQEKNPDVKESKAVKTLMLMKTPALKPDPKKIHYMSLKNESGESDYQNRKLPLQTPEELTGQESFGKIDKGNDAKVGKVAIKPVTIKAEKISSNESRKMGIQGKRTENSFVARVESKKGHLIFLRLNRDKNSKGVLHISRLEGTGYRFEDFQLGQEYYVFVVEENPKKGAQCKLSL